MNTGVEAVESGIKVTRKWGYEVKGVPEDRVRVVVMAGGSRAGPPRSSRSTATPTPTPPPCARPCPPTR